MGSDAISRSPRLDNDYNERTYIRRFDYSNLSSSTTLIYSTSELPSNDRA